jgi:hypothetical protein
VRGPSTRFSICFHQLAGAANHHRAVTSHHAGHEPRRRPSWRLYRPTHSFATEVCTTSLASKRKHTKGRSGGCHRDGRSSWSPARSRRRRLLLLPMPLPRLAGRRSRHVQRKSSPVLVGCRPLASMCTYTHGFWFLCRCK